MTDHLLPLRAAITGGTAGLGLSLVRELLARGAHVAFVARHRDDVERTMIDFPTARGIVGDVSRKEHIHPTAIQILGALGGLDVLINNASSLGPVPLRPLANRAMQAMVSTASTRTTSPVSTKRDSGTSVCTELQTASTSPRYQRTTSRA